MMIICRAVINYVLIIYWTNPPFWWVWTIIDILKILNYDNDFDDFELLLIYLLDSLEPEFDDFVDFELLLIHLPHHRVYSVPKHVFI